MANFKRGQIQILREGGNPRLIIGKANCQGAGGGSKSIPRGGESTPSPPPPEINPARYVPIADPLPEAEQKRRKSHKSLTSLTLAIIFQLTPLHSPPCPLWSVGLLDLCFLISRDTLHLPQLHAPTNSPSRSLPQPL